MSTPIRQSAAFPEVAYIRKGTPKRKGRNDGQWIQGTDLKNKFRIQFLPGADVSKAKFHELHAKEYKQYGDQFALPDGYEVKELRCMIPFRDAFKGWSWANEAYNAGRRIARANDDYYIEKRDPLNGQYIIRNGEPQLRFNVGDTIDYERKGNKYSLKVGFHGNLRVFLPELDQFVFMTLKTTSFYDRTTIEPNLGSMNEIAELLNQGISGGIPFYMYRAEKDVAWNHADGTASRTKIWSVFLRIDDEWVKQAVARMKRAALGDVVAGMLERGETIAKQEVQGNVDPVGETFDENDETIVDADHVVEHVQPETTSPTLSKNERYKPTGACGWLIEVHSLSTSDAAQVANKLKLTETNDRNVWAKRYSNFRSLIDASKSIDEAAKITLGE